MRTCEDDYPLDLDIVYLSYLNLAGLAPSILYNCSMWLVPLKNNCEKTNEVVFMSLSLICFLDYSVAILSIVHVTLTPSTASMA